MKNILLVKEISRIDLHFFPSKGTLVQSLQNGVQDQDSSIQQFNNFRDMA